MNRGTILQIVVLLFFSAWFNSALTYSSFNKAPDVYSKSVAASSRTIWVPDNITTIQEAINNAREGDTIFVRAGRYYEHLIVDKALSLVGENKHNTTIDGSGTGIVVHVMANNITLSGFTIQNGGLGILFWRSSNNIFTGNTASNSPYGISFWGSSNNIFAGSTISSNNRDGISLYYSHNNTLTGNTAANNSHYGIYLDGSDNNVLTGNTASNSQYGIHLYHSSNNILSGNTASNSQYGIYVSDSGYNVLSGNTATNNSQYGIFLYYSSNNIFSGNTASNNSRYGISLGSSSNNLIFHNNFINNGEPPSSINSVNSWDDDAEGNYWSDYDGTDADWDGIGDAPYSIDENSQDNYPLMAMFLQFDIATENQSYKIDTVCNFTISNFQYHYDPDNRTSTVSFKVKGTEGKGFCRISVPHALIEPPYTVTVDHNSPLYFKIVYTNGTHTWLYFTFDHSESEVIIMQTPYPEQLVLYQWAILGLTVIIVVLLSIGINYYRKFNEHKKVIEAYKRELGIFPVSHSERARARLIKDVIERKEKIEKFKKKYGIKIQPAGTLEDLMEKLGVKKKVKR